MGGEEANVILYIFLHLNHMTQKTFELEGFFSWAEKTSIYVIICVVFTRKTEASDFWEHIPT
jgi:hypothetical protein